MHPPIMPQSGTPDRRTLQALCEQILPGGRLTSCRRLAGGISSLTLALSLCDRSGAEERLVLRIYGDEALAWDSNVALREWTALNLLQRAGIACPVPRWYGTSDDLPGRPALLMSRLPGRGGLRAGNLDAGVTQLACALASVHQVSLQEIEARQLESGVFEELNARSWEGRFGTDTVAAVRAVFSAWPGADARRKVLLHGDYWPGNVLWNQGRLTGVVDWERVRVGPAGYDVGYCRLDLALSYGQGRADQFYAEYRRASRFELDDLAVWDLAAAWRALPDPAAWLPAWRAVGVTHLTETIVRDRLERFIQRAVSRVK
jgi:aminoglycoside phosphotransferase (APT) family kinase protein